MQESNEGQRSQQTCLRNLCLCTAACTRLPFMNQLNLHGQTTESDQRDRGMLWLQALFRSEASKVGAPLRGQGNDGLHHQ